MMSCFYGPGTILSVLLKVTHLTFTATLRSKHCCCHPHFTEEETKTEMKQFVPGHSASKQQNQEGPAPGYIFLTTRPNHTASPEFAFSPV